MRRPRKVMSRSHAALHSAFNVATDTFRTGTPSQTASLCSSFCFKLSMPKRCTTSSFCAFLRRASDQ